MKKSFVIHIYDMPSINFKVSKTTIQRVLINTLDKFVDIEEV